MRATENLSREHRVIERVLDVLTTAAERLRDGQAVRAGLFIDAADFIRDYADTHHHAKEEGVLFEAIVAAGLPRDAGPIGVMLNDHERSRGYARAMRAAAEELAAGDAGAAARIVPNALDYAQLLRQHIAKEDNILYPLAGEVVPPAEQERVCSECDRLDAAAAQRGVQEKFLALADRLAAEMAG